MGLLRYLLVALLAVTLGGCEMSRQESNQLVLAGIEQAKAENTLDAVRRLQEAIRIDPTNGPAHYYLGLIRLQKYADPRAAAQHLADAVAHLDEVAEVHYQLGVALAMNDETAAAMVALARAVELEPEHGRALYRMGVIDEGEGRIRDAIDRYARAIHVRPRLTPAYASLGSIYARYGRPREAAQVFRNGIRNENPNDGDTRAARAQCRSELGRVLFEQGEYEDAVRYLGEAAQLRPESSAIQFNLGLALRERYRETSDGRDRERALNHLQRAATQCSATTERARCESIQAALQELREAPAN